MTVDAKLTAALAVCLLVLAAPVAAHHKDGHAQGNADEAGQDAERSSRTDGPDRSERAQGPPDHAQADDHAQAPLPSEEDTAEDPAEDPAEDTADPASQDTSATTADGTSETSTDTTASEETAPEDTTADDQGTPATDADTTTSEGAEPVTTDEAAIKPTREARHDPQPATLPEGSEAGSTADDGGETSDDAEEAPTANGTASPRQDAFTGLLAPTTGQPLVANALDADRATPARSAQAQGPATGAPGWDLVPLLLIGLAALTGGGMATLRRKGSDPEASATGPQPTEPEPATAPGPGTNLPPGAPALLEIAQAAVRRGDHEAAIGWFESAIALQPDLPVAHLCLGVCLGGLGRDEEALESLGHASKLSPGDPIPVFHQARLLARSGRSQEALEQLARVVPVLPDTMIDGLVDDEAFEGLLDHPRFLALTGRL